MSIGTLVRHPTHGIGEVVGIRARSDSDVCYPPDQYPLVVRFDNGKNDYYSAREIEEISDVDTIKMDR